MKVGEEEDKKIADLLHPATQNDEDDDEVGDESFVTEASEDSAPETEEEDDDNTTPNASGDEDEDDVIVLENRGVRSLAVFRCQNSMLHGYKVDTRQNLLVTAEEWTKSKT